MIGVGAVLVTSSFSSFWSPYLNAALTKLTTVDFSGVNSTIDLTQLIIGGIFILLGLLILFLKIYLNHLEKTATLPKHILQIKHWSLENIVDYSKVEGKILENEITPLELNQTEELKVVNQSNMERALKAQDRIIMQITIFLTKGINYNPVYMGLAHIPLVFLLGYQLADKFKPEYYEWIENSWNEIKDEEFTYPTLELINKEDLDISALDGNIAIKIGITYAIDDSDLNALDISFMRIFNLQIESPHRYAIVSKTQLSDYAKIFRNLLDQINQNYLNVSKIHIFYSGQPSLAFVLGSVLSKRMDVENIYVYNHNRSESIRYSWSIKMFKEFTSIDNVFKQHGR